MYASYADFWCYKEGSIYLYNRVVTIWKKTCIICALELSLSQKQFFSILSLSRINSCLHLQNRYCNENMMALMRGSIIGAREAQTMLLGLAVINLVLVMNSCPCQMLIDDTDGTDGMHHDTARE